MLEVHNLSILPVLNYFCISMQRPGTAVEKPKSHTQGQGEDSCHGPQTILRKQRKSFDVVKIAQEQAADLDGAEKEGWLRWLQKNKHKKNNVNKATIRLNYIYLDMFLYISIYFLYISIYFLVHVC